MRSMNTNELFSMEVINLCDGCKLGCPSALELDCDGGSVSALLIPCRKGLSLFGKTEHYRIPWCKIQCIGEDTILVKITATELISCTCKPAKEGHFFG